MSEIAGLAEKAAAQNDRYLFVLLIFVCFAAFFWAIRWLIGRDDRKHDLLVGLFNDSNACREKVVGILAETALIVKEGREGREKLTQVVSEASLVISECKEVITENTEFLKKAASYRRGGS